MEGKHKFRLVSLRFIDSFQFMSTLLEKLVKNLPRDKMIIVRQMAGNEEQFSLLLRKGVFPTIIQRDGRSLMIVNYHLDRRSSTNLGRRSYLLKATVTLRINISNLGEYPELYLKLDVLLLGDVFENFRVLGKDIYKLDPAHYITAPGLAWDVELIRYANMLLMIEYGIRGETVTRKPAISTILKIMNRASRTHICFIPT